MQALWEVTVSGAHRVGRAVPWQLSVLAACPLPRAHAHGGERGLPSQLAWAHPAREATALVEVARPSAFWDSPGRQPGVPTGLWLLQKTRSWEGGHVTPRVSALPTRLLQLHRPVSVGVGEIAVF